MAKSSTDIIKESVTDQRKSMTSPFAPGTMQSFAKAEDPLKRREREAMATAVEDAYRNAAFDRLEEALGKMNCTAQRRTNNYWIVTDPNGDMSSINPLDVIADWKPIEPSGRQYEGLWDEFDRAVAGGLASGASAGLDLLSRSVKRDIKAKSGGWYPSIEGMQESNEAKAKELDAKAQFYWELSQDPELARGEGGGVRGFMAHAVGGTFAYMSASVGATMATGGNPLAGFGVAFAIEGNSAYRAAIADGATKEQAEVVRIVVGTLVGAIEMAQVGRILKFGKATEKGISELLQIATRKALAKIAAKGKKLTVKTLRHAITEGLEEATQELVQIGSVKIYGGKLPSAEEIIKQVGAAAAGGATVGFLMPVAGGAISGTMKADREAAVANRLADRMAQEQAAEALEKALFIDAKKMEDLTKREPLRMEKEIAIRRLIRSGRTEWSARQTVGRMETAAELKNFMTLVDTEGGALITPEAEETKPNPYLDMPQDIRARDASNEYGVALAQQAEYELGEKIGEDPTKLQIAQIQRAVLKHGLDEGSLHALIKDRTGLDNIEELTKEDATEVLKALTEYEYMDPAGMYKIVAKADRLVDKNLPIDEAAYLERIAGSRNGYNRVINYSNVNGGYPINDDIPDLRGRQAQWVRDLRRFAQKGRKIEKGWMERAVEQGKRFLGHELFNPFQSARYAMDTAEIKTGILLRRPYSNMVADVAGYNIRNEEALKQAGKRAGVHRLGKITNYQDNIKIAHWLDTSDPAMKSNLWADMDEKTQALAVEVKNLLQGPIARDVRWAQFVRWDEAAIEAKEYINNIVAKGKTPTKQQIMDANKMVEKHRPSNAPKSALLDGQYAFAQSHEMGMEWLANETWGTRMDYFMHEGGIDDLTSYFVGGSIPQDVFFTQAEVGTLKDKPPGELEPRKGGTEVMKSGNVLLDVLRHWDRVTAYASTHKARRSFWEAFSSTKPSKGDISSMRTTLDAMLGIHHATHPIVKVSREADKWFWRMHLVGDPRTSIHFAWRQSLQNLAFMPSQVNMKEIGKTLLEFPHINAVARWMRNNPDSEQSWKEYFNKNIAENRAVNRFFLMKSQELSGIDDPSKIMAIRKATTLLDTLAVIPGLTDRGNRLAAWPLLYRTAERNVFEFVDGRINQRRLWGRLQMRTLTAGQSLEMQELLNKGDYSQFMNRYAEYKLENIHGRYKPGLRSMAEMTPAGRVFMGLITFPRIAFNIAYKNGFEPMMYGGPREAYQGFKTLIKLYLGTGAAHELSKKLWGFGEYSLGKILGGYGLGSVGFSKISDLNDEMNSIIARAPEGESVGKTALKMFKVGSKHIEMFIPFCEVMLDYHKVRKNYRYESLYDYARSLSMSEWEKMEKKPFTPMDRSVQEKIAIWVFDKEIHPEDSDWKELEDALKKR